MGENNGLDGFSNPFSYMKDIEGGFNQGCFSERRVNPPSTPVVITDHFFHILLTPFSVMCVAVHVPMHQRAGTLGFYK